MVSVRHLRHHFSPGHEKAFAEQKEPEWKDEPDVDSMVGEMAKVLEPLEPQALGKVELRGSTWNARNAGRKYYSKEYHRQDCAGGWSDTLDSSRIAHTGGIICQVNY